MGLALVTPLDISLFFQLKEYLKDPSKFTADLSREIASMKAGRLPAPPLPTAEDEEKVIFYGFSVYDFLVVVPFF